jgi:hypothetical protein
MKKQGLVVDVLHAVLLFGKVRSNNQATQHGHYHSHVKSAIFSIHVPTKTKRDT